MNVNDFFGLIIKKKRRGGIVKHYDVMLTHDAAQDLTELYHYIFSHDSPQKADYVLDRIEQAFSSSSEFPERGVFPQELTACGIKEYREFFFKPYRIIYRIVGPHVYVMLIVDGRRDMEAVLRRRLLNSE